MKKIILLSLFAFMSFSFHQAEAISETLSFEYGFPYFYAKDGSTGLSNDYLEEERQHQRKFADTGVCSNTAKLEEAIGKKRIVFFPKKNVLYPYCFSNIPEGYNSIDYCKWKVGDYTDDGILLYATETSIFDRIKQGTRIFVYTDNIDFVTDDCFYDEFIYEQTKNFKYTSVMGRTIVVKAYRKTDYKYQDFTKTREEIRGY